MSDETDFNNGGILFTSITIGLFEEQMIERKKKHIGNKEILVKSFGPIWSHKWMSHKTNNQIKST